MQLAPTMDGRIKFTIDDKSDYHFFATMLADASGDHKVSTIIDQVSLGKGDEDWQEFIKPDLVTQYQDDLLTVSKQLESAQEEQLSEIFISHENARQWYSTLNQARLRLENEYQVTSIEDNPMEMENLEQAEACMKNDYYLQIQSIILEVIDDFM